jgi:hypothetical protein
VETKNVMTARANFCPISGQRADIVKISDSATTLLNFRRKIPIIIVLKGSSTCILNVINTSIQTKECKFWDVACEETKSDRLEVRNTTPRSVYGRTHQSAINVLYM